MNQVFRLVLAAMALYLSAVVSFAQVTTSSLGGHVFDQSGNVEGAVITAVHTPSGTQYHAVSGRSGNYRIHNMRIGGPYTLSVQLLGYAEARVSGIMLKLGETYVQDVELKEESVSLDALVFSVESDNTILTSDKVGTSANISRCEMVNLPTATRTIEDIVKLTPQSNGMSFGGRDSRYNNFSVDGAGFNNNFGLDSGLSGGSSGPISFDAIEEISVSLAPYDVRQSRFTGASINAVTKSGTNSFDGSVYTYQKFKGMTGGMVGGLEVPGTSDLASQTYGFSVGGPIIKDKLFFFVNAEYAPVTSPGPQFRPSTDGNPDVAKGVARTTVADLEAVRKHLLDKYRYDPGEYGKGGWSAFNDYNYKILARVDWNINQNHRLMIRYNDVKNSVMTLTNGNSCPPGLPRNKEVLRSGGPDAIAFSKNFYRQNHNVRSIAAELNSRFSENISNSLLASYNMISKPRDPQSELFPHVDIFKEGKQYMSFGMELFSYNNNVIDNTAVITDNLTVNLDDHTLTAGVSFEYVFEKNSYIREGSSYYRYASVEDFLEDKTPIGMGIQYGYDGVEAPGVTLNYGQLSAYVQDEWDISRRFKLTYGVRLELPMYLDTDMGKNQAIYRIAQENGFDGGWDTSSWPKSHLTVNPRVGFNWDVLGDRSLQLRGGTGIFTGLNPFVWFTNQVGSAGLYQSPEMSIMDFSNMPGLKFTPDYRDLMAAYPDVFPQAADPDYLAPNSTICLVDKDFRFPQIWRSNLAVDVRLPWNMVFTAEALFSRDIVGVRQLNLNEAASTGTMYGADNRPVWDHSKLTIMNKYYPVVTTDVAAAMLLTNTKKKGYSAQFTAQLTKNFSYGFTGSLAYTYSDVREVTSNPGSAAYSAWSSGTGVGSLNTDELGHSGFSIPHRIVANLSWRIDYAKHFATTLSVFYQGAHKGRMSYIYGGDVNGDGIAADLMYIPADASEINFADLVVTGEDGTETLLASAQDQSKAFFEFVDSNPYLCSRKGQYVERFGGLQKWVNMFDVKILQDLYMNFGADNRYSLQLSLDILNVGNMINSNWGCYWASSALTDYNRTLLNVASKGSETAAPTYTLNVGDASKVAKDAGVEAFRNVTSWSRALDAANCWSMLFGIRLTF